MKKFCWAWLMVMLCGQGFADDADFFADKRLTYIVATRPGGGYDQYARLIARYLPRYLGVRSVVVRNVPGAGHLIGLQQVFQAKPDGLTIGTFNTGLITGLADANLPYDLNRLSWIGKAAAEPRVFMVNPQSGLHALEDLRQRQSVLIATSGKLTASHLDVERVAVAFGIRTRPVHGFTGYETGLAIVRGDVDGALLSLSTALPLAANHQTLPLFSIGDVSALEDLRDVPTLGSLAQTSGERRAADQLLAFSELGRLSAGPPGIPAERLERLRGAYLRALSDPDLLEEARKQRLMIAPLGGEQVADLVREHLPGPSP